MGDNTLTSSTPPLRQPMFIWQYRRDSVHSMFALHHVWEICDLDDKYSAMLAAKRCARHRHYLQACGAPSALYSLFPCLMLQARSTRAGAPQAPQPRPLGVAGGQSSKRRRHGRCSTCNIVSIASRARVFRGKQRRRRSLKGWLTRWQVARGVFERAWALPAVHFHAP